MGQETSFAPTVPDDQPLSGLPFHSCECLACKKKIGSVSRRVPGIHFVANLKPLLRFPHDIGLVARRFGGSICSRVVGSTQGLNPVEEEGPEACERFGGVCGTEVLAMLVFPVFKQAGEIIEVRVFPGFYPRLVIPAMTMAKLVVVAVRVTVRMIVRVIVRVTMRVLFSRRMLVWFSPVPVDVNRAAHGERKSTPERT